VLAGVVGGAAIVPTVGQHGRSPVECHGQGGGEREHVNHHGNVGAHRDGGRTLAGPIEADPVSTLSKEVAHPQSVLHRPGAPRRAAPWDALLGALG
jgi:hypothetical protein